jgi:hypothetical protein
MVPYHSNHAILRRGWVGLYQFTGEDDDINRKKKEFAQRCV